MQWRARVFQCLLWPVGWGIWLLPNTVYRVLLETTARLFAATGVRRRVIVSNFERAFPHSSVSERHRQIHQAYLHLAALFFELFFLFGPIRRIAERRVAVSGLEHWIGAQGQGKGVFFLSSHVGNWEFMVAHGGYSRGMSLLMVTKRLKPDWFHDAFETARARLGVRGTYEPKTLRDVLSTLKSGGTVGFVLDQFTGPPVGIEVPFFGGMAGTHSALATLAKRTGAPVVPVMVYRKGHPAQRQYQIEISPPVPWLAGASLAEEVALNTARYAQIIESHIRAHPEQWLWSHRRFKSFGV